MSPQELTAKQLAENPPEQKQRANIYTMMLILAFIAICIACTLLWLELQSFGAYPWWKTEGVTPASAMLDLVKPLVTIA